MTYNDKTITYSGDLASYDYDAILRDKQRNINSLYELADYYVDADPIFRGIINGVYVPFSLSDDFRLMGANEQTKAKYLEYYDRIHLKDRMRSIFYQYFKYGNVYCYLMEDGNIITLPVHLVRIANVMIGGEPVLEFNCKSVRDDMRQQGVKAQKDFLEDEDLKVRLEGFPKEVSDAINKGSDWVQMNPENTFVMQGLKGSLYAHWPVYSSGTDCTESAIKGWLHLYVPRVRVTALPGFDNSYKSAATNGVTFSAIDPKRADEKMYDIYYEPLDADGQIVTTTTGDVKWN